MTAPQCSDEVECAPCLDAGDEGVCAGCCPDHGYDVEPAGWSFEPPPRPMETVRVAGGVL